MSTILDELEDFVEFAKQTATGRPDGPSLEECMRLWREEREVEETVAAVKRGEANFASGRCMSLAEAEQRLRNHVDSPADVR